MKYYINLKAQSEHLQYDVVGVADKYLFCEKSWSIAFRPVQERLNKNSINRSPPSENIRVQSHPGATRNPQNLYTCRSLAVYTLIALSDCTLDAVLTQYIPVGR
jgi:hypothetical protein